MWPTSRTSFVLLLALTVTVHAQQECYFGPGAANRGPSSLVPCLSSGTSACCLLGDTCLSGNTCYNYATGDLYQYGCTDVTYTDDSCPYKCGWNTTLSPWVALEYCTDVENVDNTWTCHAPESCGCDWNSTDELLVLQPRQCKEMGNDARVALYAPSVLAPYVSLPATIGGSTGYYSTTVVNGTSTWVSTAVAGYTPSPVTQLATYQDGPSSAVVIEPGATPSPSTNAAPKSASATTPAAAASSSSTSISSSASVSSTANVTAPATTSSASSALSPGAKAGIGVGVAGGVCLLAAVAFAAYLWGKRHRERKAQETQPGQNPQGPQYPQSPPMQQGAPYYPSPGEKPPGWQPGYPTGQQYQQSPYFDTNNPSPYMHDVQPHWAGVPSPPLDQMSQKHGSLSPTMAPMELPAESRVHEIGSLPAPSPPTPAPAYAEFQRSRATSQ